jgi:glycosyltransferase involved in cell wall biosynthesis
MLPLLIGRIRRRKGVRKTLRPLLVWSIARYCRRILAARGGPPFLYSAVSSGHFRLRLGYRHLRRTLIDVPIIGPAVSLPAAFIERRREARQFRQSRQAFEAVTRLAGPVGIGQYATGDLIVMLVISDLRIDPRVEREARTLAAAGWRVLVLYPDIFTQDDAPAQFDWGNGVFFERLPLQAAEYCSVFPCLYGSDYLRAALRHRPFAYHAHDLSTAMVGLAAGQATGAHVVCDFHEWFSENVEWDPLHQRYVPIRQAKKKVWREAEREALASASAVVTVCESIAEDMERELGGGSKRIHIIRNIPDLTRMPTRSFPPLREQVGAPEGAFILLWQGGTGPTRLLEPVIESLQYVPEVVFIIRGPSLELFGEGYKALARAVGVEDRLILQPPVASRDVVAAAHGADAGIWTLPALCKNFTYALPNKIFEYLAAGLPVLAARYPEACRFVENYGVGLSFDPLDPKSIAAAIYTLKDDSSQRAQIVERIPDALKAIDAEREWNKLVSIYSRLKESKGAPVEMPVLGRSAPPAKVTPAHPRGLGLESTVP